MSIDSTDLSRLSPEQLALLQRRLQQARKGAEPDPQRIVRQSREAASFPLAAPQQILWFLDQLEPGNTSATIPIACRLQGELDPGALARSLDAVVRRHEILRTRFVSEGGRPSQVILPELSVQMPVVAVDHHPEAEREARARELVAEQLRLPFDLARGPLLRAQLIRLGASTHLFLLTFHHIVADAWSAGLLIGEIVTHYAAFRQGIAPELPELPIQYADFACWQQERLQGERLDRLMTYWKESLAGAPPVLDLPTDRPRPEVQRFAYETLKAALPGPLVAELRALGRREDVTLFALLLAAFYALLQRYSGRTDLFAGAPVLNRAQNSVQRLIGCFGNILVLRADLAGDPTFRELLGRVREVVHGAFAHEELPFNTLVRELALERSPSYIPLLQVMFNLQSAGAWPEIRIPGLTVELVELDLGTMHDLDLMLVERDDEIAVTFKYNPDLFDAETARLLLSGWTGMLEECLRDPGRKLSELAFPEPLAARAEAARRRDRKVDVAVAATFTADPLAEPLELWLEELGIPGRVRLAPYNQVFQQLLDPTGLFAANRSGLNVVLLRFEDWRRFRAGEGEGDPERELNELVGALASLAERASVPSLVIVCPSSNPSRAALDRSLEERLAERVRGMEGTFLMLPEELAARYPLASVHDRHADELGHVPYTPAFFAALATAVARALYAFRSTPPKVVVLDCDGTLWHGVGAEDGAQGVVIDAASRALQELMVAQHDAGLLLCVCSKNEEADVRAVFARPDMVLRPEHVAAWRVNWRPKSENVRSLSEELSLGLDSFLVIDDNPVERAEIRAACPEALVLELPAEREELPRFFRHVWAFDRLRVTEEDRRRTALYQQGRERALYRRETASFADFLAGLGLEVEIAAMGWGQAERVSQLTQRTNQLNANTVRRSKWDLRTLCTARGYDCLVVEARDRFGDYGLVGAMLVKAAGRTLAVEDFLLSCRALGKGVEHRMLARLGEIARERGLDEVTVAFRPTPRNRPAADFLESVGGAWREPAAEGALYRIPAAVAAAVAFVPREAEPERVSETSEAAPSSRTSPVDRRAEGERLARIATRLSSPQAVLDLLAERRQHARPEDAGELVEPRTPIEQVVAELCQEILGVERVGAHDSFFRLGGHSLLGTVLLSRVRDAFDVELPLHVLFEAPTIAGLSARIEEELIGSAGGSLDEELSRLDGLSEEEIQALLAEEAGALDAVRPLRKEGRQA